MVPSEAAARKFFEPHIDWLAGALLRGWAEYQEIGAGLRAKHRPRSKSSSVNDFIVHEAEASFNGDGCWIERHGTRQLVLGNTYRIKFKKLDRNLRPMSTGTQAFFDFLNQLPYQLLPHTPDPLVNVAAGYTVNKVGSLAGIFIACPDGRRNAWVISLPMDKAAGMATFQPQPTVGPMPQQPRRVLPKPPSQTAADKS